MTSEYTPTVGELRQAYVEASGATVAQESYYAEQVAEFERGIARIKAEAWDEGFGAGDGYGYDGALFERGIAITEPEDPTNPYRGEAGL